MELKGLTDIYKVNKNNEEYIYKKDVIYKIHCEPQHIGPYVELLNKKGKPYKQRCQVYIENIGVVTVKHNPKELNSLKQHSTIPIGFNAYKGN